MTSGIVTFLAFSASLLTAAEFPTPYNSEKDKTANPPSPEEAAASFKLPEGFQVTVLAAEPEVQNPIAMAWDHKGRMWVAENYTYAERGKRFDLELRDRIIILHDEDHDGESDTRKVFTDKLQMLTSVELGRGGVWAMCPPQLLFIPDRNGDDIPDGKPEVILDGFTVAKNNYHNFANGLRWGPDGWLYGRCGGSCPGNVGVPGSTEAQRVPIEGGIWRFHPDRKAFEVLTHGTTNPWGHDWDEHGELFHINTVNGHLWHMIPGAHFERPFAPSPNKLVFEPIQMHADHWHFDRTGSWTKSRNGAANDFGGGHSHIGMCIYQGGHLPEYWNGKLLTWNQHGKRLNVERLERQGSGYTAKHEPDVMISGDQWFRGLEITTGPGGALYGLDWSDTGECHDHTGVHRTSGRIYRFSKGPVTKPDFSLLEDIDDQKLARIIQHPNVWFERQARLILAYSNPPVQLSLDAVGLTEKGDPATTLRALWTLNTLGAAKPLQFMEHPDEHVRAFAIRQATDELPIDHVYGTHPRHVTKVDSKLMKVLHKLAQSDPSAKVRLTLASTLQRIPLTDRPSLASALASRDDAKDHNLPKLIWFGISPLLKDHPEGLIRVAEATEWPDLLRYISRALAPNPDAIINLAIKSPSKAPHILQGLSEGFKGWRKAPLPKNWNTAIDTLSAANSDLIRDLSALFGDGRAMDSLKKIALDNNAAFGDRQTALQGLIDARADDLRNICEKLLKVRYLNKTAIRGLASFDDPGVAKTLLSRYPNLRPDEKRTIIAVIVARPAWADALLTEMKDGTIARTDLTPFHARQALALNDEKLTARLKEIWGDLRQSDATKKKRIEELHKALGKDVRDKADLPAGRVLFQNLCASCHILYGEGGKLGPDLTGSGRSDLGYLLENIVEPSAIVPAEYRMTILKLRDGRSLTGIIASSTDRTVTLRSLAEEATLEKSEIAETSQLPNSIMPAGLLSALTPGQIRDLIAYLMHPQQVPLQK
ncbi:MAG: c-type cytochrome [Akkermansiaceae bacterium]|nr:c-type cytochrome [Akkermansiaceae bacterium]